MLSREKLDDDAWEEVEEALLTADVGVRRDDRDRRAAAHPDEGARHPLAGRAAGAARRRARRPRCSPTWTARCTPRRPADRPAVVLVVGVNGTGKTTTCGKLARVLVADGRTVLLGAADTFRAAAADQLQTWGSRVGAETVRGPEGGDPASVAFDAVKQGTERKVDTVLIDTAGRLHTKVGLMDELGKVKRVVEKQGPVDETLLVLDATTGQNGLTQARVFTEVVDVTGIVLTKLDGTAKGGIVISVQRELGVPVKLVGLGEGADDLAPFDPEQFVDALLGDTADRHPMRAATAGTAAIRHGYRQGRRVKALYKPAAAPGFELVERPEPAAGPRRGEDPGAAHRHLRHRPAHRGLGRLGGRRGQRAAGARARVLRRGRRGRRRACATSRVGDLVSGEGHVVCGTCRNCRAGRRHLCIRTSSGRREPRRRVRRVRRAARVQRLGAPRRARRPRPRRDLRPVRQRRAHRAVVPAGRRGRADHRRRADRADGRGGRAGTSARASS